MPSERLVEFLYILARDELTVGAIEGIMFDHVTGVPNEYCNVWLEGWCRDLAERLTDGKVPVTNYNNMYKETGELKGITGPAAKGYDGVRPPYPVRVDVVTSDQV